MFGDNLDVMLLEYDGINEVIYILNINMYK